MTERRFEVKLPTIWIDEKKRWEGPEKRREEKRSEAKRSDATRSDATRRDTTRGEARRGEAKRSEEKRREKERESTNRKSQKKKNPGARKGRKVAKHFVFPRICGSGGSKSRLAKAAGAEPCGQMRNERLHTVVVR